jgi:hypothetical protein
MASMTSKARIVHPEFGTGNILSWTLGGVSALVQFDAENLPREVLRRDFDPDYTITMRENNEELPPPLRSALSIEAMRLGVVPCADLTQTTVGRDLEIELVKQDLEDCKNYGGARRAFLGEYGQGKTHFLELSQQIALKKNFVVSKVVLDHSENSPSQPKRIYHAVVKSMVYPDRPDELEGLRPLLEKASQNPEIMEKFLLKAAKGSRTTNLKAQLDAGLHLYLSPALAYMKALSDPATLKVSGEVENIELWAESARHALLDWIEGHPTQSNQDINTELNRIKGRFHRIYSLLDFRPWAKIYGYLLNGIAYLCKAVGYAGLVVVIDEAEFYSLLSSQNRVFAKHLFQAWSHATGGKNEASLPFSQEELLVGGYGIQRELPTRYDDDAKLYLVFAMTPNSDGVRVLHEAIEPQSICYLNALSDIDYLQITRRVCELYTKAYPQDPLPDGLSLPLSEVVNGLVQQGQFTNPRQVMKFLTEFLDIVRYRPDLLPSVLQNLMESI